MTAAALLRLPEVMLGPLNAGRNYGVISRAGVDRTDAELENRLQELSYALYAWAGRGVTHFCAFLPAATQRYVGILLRAVFLGQEGGGPNAVARALLVDDGAYRAIGGRTWRLAGLLGDPYSRLEVAGGVSVDVSSLPSPPPILQRGRSIGALSRQLQQPEMHMVVHVTDHEAPEKTALALLDLHAAEATTRPVHWVTTGALRARGAFDPWAVNLVVHGDHDAPGAAPGGAWQRAQVGNGVAQRLSGELLTPFAIWGLLLREFDQDQVPPWREVEHVASLQDLAEMIAYGVARRTSDTEGGRGALRLEAFRKLADAAATIADEEVRLKTQKGLTRAAIELTDDEATCAAEWISKFLIDLVPRLGGVFPAMSFPQAVRPDVLPRLGENEAWALARQGLMEWQPLAEALEASDVRPGPLAATALLEGAGPLQKPAARKAAALLLEDLLAHHLLVKDAPSPTVTQRAAVLSTVEALMTDDPGFASTSAGAVSTVAMSTWAEEAEWRGSDKSPALAADKLRHLLTPPPPLNRLAGTAFLQSVPVALGLSVGVEAYKVVDHCQVLARTTAAALEASVLRIEAGRLREAGT